MISSMLKNPAHYNNYNFVLNIEREKKRVSPVDAESKKFSVKSIEIYDAREINPFSEIPESVTNLTYKLDLIGKKQIAESEWKGEFDDR